MRLSTKGCYGLRAMLDLALNYGGGPMLMRTISDKEGISRKYLHALLSTLRTAGLVRSIRGSGGGYTLSRAPSQITLCEVIQALEGSLCVTECVHDESVCSRSDICVGRDVWTEISVIIENLLSNITLEELVARQAQKIAKTNMYYI